MAYTSQDIGYAIYVQTCNIYNGTQQAIDSLLFRALHAWNNYLKSEQQTPPDSRLFLSPHEYFLGIDRNL